MEDQELRDLQEELSLLTALQSHPGWKYYKLILQSQIDKHEEANHIPLTSADDGYAKNTILGRMEGLRLAIRTLDTSVDQLKEQVKFHEDEEV